MRRSTVLWFLIAACLGVAVFLVKYEVQEREERLAELHREILANQEAVHVLEAEWSYLNRPSRLESLVRRHLDLVPMDTTRLGQIDRLPMRLVTPDQDPAGSLDAEPGDAKPTDAISADVVPAQTTVPPVPLIRPIPASAGGRQ